MLPIHWGTFNLALHPWAEPAEWSMRATQFVGVTMVAPHPGRPFEPADPPAVEPWWRRVAAEPAPGWGNWPPVHVQLPGGARTPAPDRDRDRAAQA